MKAKELLEIDFSKYKRFSINGVITEGVKIVAQRGYFNDIALKGFVNDSLIFTTFYEVDEKTRITEHEDGYLVISKKQEVI